jgi:alpha-beta hydrolase superfamily lysophospholipase
VDVGPRRRRWSFAIVAMLAAVILVAVAGCADDKRSADSAQTYRPGELLSEPMDFAGYPAVDALAQRAAKIRYRSTSGIDGSATAVTGVVFVPKGDPPPQGWPIASIGHWTTGITGDCAPSLYPTLMGNLPHVVTFLSQGFVVVMSDYQGLGSPGPHPYLEPKTAAYNVIDAVRAARQAVPNTSDTWVGYGVSQGAQAVWAANELAPEYGTGLRLAGSISVSPPTDLSPLVDAMENGALTPDQIAVLPLVLKGVQAVHPDLRLEDYLHGVLADRADVFFACSGADDDAKLQVVKSVTPQDYKPASPGAADQLRGWLAEFSLPTRRTEAPMQVVYGDADPILDAAWTAEGIRRACALGDVIEVHVLPGQGHGVPFGNPADWANDRLAGKPVDNSCANPLPESTR